MSKKPTPIQAARAWARQHPGASGCIAVQYLSPKGRGGRRGMTNRRDHYLVDGGKAVKFTSRRVPDGKYRHSLGGGTSGCTRDPLVVLGLD